MSNETYKKLEDILIDGLLNDGSRHKQNTIFEALKLIISPERIQELVDVHGEEIKGV